MQPADLSVEGEMTQSPQNQAQQTLGSAWLMLTAVALTGKKPGLGHHVFIIFKKQWVSEGCFVSFLLCAFTSLAVKLLLTILTHWARAVRKGKRFRWLSFPTHNPQGRGTCGPCWGSRETGVTAPRGAHSTPECWACSWGRQHFTERAP